MQWWCGTGMFEVRSTCVWSMLKVCGKYTTYVYTIKGRTFLRWQHTFPPQLQLLHAFSTSEIRTPHLKEHHISIYTQMRILHSYIKTQCHTVCTSLKNTVWSAMWHRHIPPFWGDESGRQRWSCQWHTRRWTWRRSWKSLEGPSSDSDTPQSSCPSPTPHLVE